MTKNQKTKKLILIIFLLIICSALIYIYKKPTEKNIGSIAEIQNIDKQVLPVTNRVNNITLEINGIKYDSNVSSEISVYDFMGQLQNEGKITFKEKTYSGMGKFIEEINGIKNNDKNWIYYVNNKKAEIGVSNYKINKGDLVSWRYE